MIGKSSISAGVLYALLSVFLYSVSASIVKFLSHGIPVMEVVFFRGVVSLILIVSYMKFKHYKFKVNNLRFWILRGFIGALGQVIYIYLISTMKLADIMTLTLITPIFVAIFARIFLAEKLSPYFIIAFFMAMIGAGLVVKPGFDYTVPSLLLGLLMTIFAGVAYTVTRFLTRNNSIYVIVLSFIFFSLLYSTPFVLRHFIVPNFNEVFGIIALGIIVTGAMLTLAKAYSMHDTPSATISMMSYFKIVFAILFGFMFWRELPDFLSILGSLIIVISTLLLKKKRRRAVII